MLSLLTEGSKVLQADWFQCYYFLKLQWLDIVKATMILNMCIILHCQKRGCIIYSYVSLESSVMGGQGIRPSQTSGIYNKKNTRKPSILRNVCGQALGRPADMLATIIRFCWNKGRSYKEFKPVSKPESSSVKATPSPELALFYSLDM